MPYQEKFSRNVPSLSAKEQEKLRRARLCVVGLGGTGGFALECLARMGAGDFVLFDKDRFELTNFNRQLLATDATLDMVKAEAAAERIRSINRKIKIEINGEFGPEPDLKTAAAIAGCAAVIDCTDSLAAKKLISETCRGLSVPHVFCSAQGTRGMVAVFAGYPFSKAFQLDGAKKAKAKPAKYAAERACASVLAPAASLAGTLAAAQALNVILGRPFIRAPDALFFDIFGTRVFWKGKLG